MDITHLQMTLIPVSLNTSPMLKLDCGGNFGTLGLIIDLGSLDVIGHFQRAMFGEGHTMGPLLGFQFKLVSRCAWAFRS